MLLKYIYFFFSFQIISREKYIKLNFKILFNYTIKKMVINVCYKLSLRFKYIIVSSNVFFSSDNFAQNVVRLRVGGWLRDLEGQEEVLPGHPQVSARHSRDRCARAAFQQGCKKFSPPGKYFNSKNFLQKKVHPIQQFTTDTETIRTYPQSCF